MCSHAACWYQIRLRTNKFFALCESTNLSTMKHKTATNRNPRPIENHEQSNDMGHGARKETQKLPVPTCPIPVTAVRISLSPLRYKAKEPNHYTGKTNRKDLFKNTGGGVLWENNNATHHTRTSPPRKYFLIRSADRPAYGAT